MHNVYIIEILRFALNDNYKLLFTFSFQVSNRLALANHLTLLRTDFYNAAGEANMHLFEAAPRSGNVAEEVVLLVLGSYRR